jgi:prophage regulatory protein
MAQQIIKLPEVLAIVKCSKAKVYGEIKKGTFPRPIKLGDRAVAWVMDDVREWLEQRIKQSKQDNAA